MTLIVEDNMNLFKKKIRTVLFWMTALSFSQVFLLSEVHSWSPLPIGNIDTVAGDGSSGSSGDGGPATSASLSFPFGSVGVDKFGNIYIPDTFNNLVRRVDAITGIITTVAGGGSGLGDGGPATSASLDFPTKVVLDNDDNLFIADEGHNRIRRVDALTGVITTVAGDGSNGFSGDGGAATSASLSFPEGMALDTVGNLFIADQGNSVIRRVDVNTGIITTVAGTPGSFSFDGDGGPAASAKLNFPTDVLVDQNGNLFIADLSNNRIRRVDALTGIITTVAGGGAGGDGGPATSARLRSPHAVTIDITGNLFIADSSNHQIRKVDAVTQIITTIAGDGVATFGGDNGPAISASLDDPFGVALDESGNLFITDLDNIRIRRVFLGVADSEGPAISNIEASPSPVGTNVVINLTANANDTGTGGSNIAGAQYSIDGGSSFPMIATDGDFDSEIEDVEALVPAFPEAGVHEICVVGTDSSGNLGAEECLLLAVFDPTAGFVTGGGWISSPPGAVTQAPSLQGKANFGFVSKYKKGATTPTGQTEFNFKVANLNFHSDVYNWLVVAGHKAMYKGTGTINGGGNYGFLLSAIDAALTPSTEKDKVRIKIWDKENADALVYDNQQGAGDDEDPTTAIGGGSIVIHKGK